LKKIIFLFIVIVSVFLNGIIFAQDFDLDVESAILIDKETGQVLFEKNANKKLPPASITKVMSLLLAMEETNQGNINLDDEVYISNTAESMGGSQIFLAANTRVKFKDLLKAITIASANDACVAVAEAISGTESNFVNKMNEKAKYLGMINTHFVNTTGLPSENGEHYSTARDISIMSRELTKYPDILKWASIWLDYIKLPGREAMLVNTNKLIKSYQGMNGLKTGYTDEAGFCLNATAHRNEMFLISVIMKADSEKRREEATAKLLDYGFNAFKKKKVLNKGDKVHNIEVPDGTKTLTEAEVAADLNIMVQKGRENDLNKSVVLNELVDAPIKKGDILGKEVVTLDGKKLGEVNLIAIEDIEKAGFFTRLWRLFINWIGSILGKYNK
jgi:serine-type D-Ala-D-Ala carboxypeptidase (penicillin-binding protein 5/6)